MAGRTLLKEPCVLKATSDGLTCGRRNAAPERLNVAAAHVKPCTGGARGETQAMIRFLFRFLGLICLAGAFILAIYDGTKSIAGNRLTFTSVRTVWELLNPASLAHLKPLLSPYAHGMLWDPGMLAILASPGCTLLACFGIVFIMLGRKKKPLIGYAR